MESGDFRHNEQSMTMAAPTTARIEHVGANGSVTVLRDGIDLLADEVLDASFMSKVALVAFLEEQLARAKAEEEEAIGLAVYRHVSSCVYKCKRAFKLFICKKIQCHV